jgi:hypothetical protein
MASILQSEQAILAHNHKEPNDFRTLPSTSAAAYDCKRRHGCDHFAADDDSVQRERTATR